MNRDIDVKGFEKYTYNDGWKVTALTLFLWFVKVALDFPAAKSHNLIVQSWLPVTI